MRYLVSVLLLVCSVKLAAAQTSCLARADAIRIAEAFSLAEYVGDEVWGGLAGRTVRHSAHHPRKRLSDQSSLSDG